MCTFDCEKKVNNYLLHVLGHLTVKIFGFSQPDSLKGEKQKSRNQVK